MGRKISVIDASLRTWYTPDIDDNRSDPDPFQVLISPLSGKDMRTLRSSLKLQATSLEAEEIMQAAERREDELRGLIVAQHVHDVRGYVAQDVTTGKVTEPKTGAELVECILSAHPDELIVLTDVYEAIMKASTLSEEAKKKTELAIRFAVSGDTRRQSWGCSKCRGSDFAGQDHLRRQRNCNGDPDFRRLGIQWAPELNRCPWAEIGSTGFEMLNAWNDFRDLGVLPYGGRDLMDQPAFVLEAFKVIEQTKTAAELEQARQAEKRAARRA